MKFTCIPMYSFKISKVGGSLEITTKMLSLLSPRMALEEYGYVVEERSFKKGNILFSYYADRDNVVNIDVWNDKDVLIARIRRVEFINVLITVDCVVLTAPNCKVTVNVV